MTDAQADAGQDPLAVEAAGLALAQLYQLHAPRLDGFLHPARVALERFLRNGPRAVEAQEVP